LGFGDGSRRRVASLRSIGDLAPAPAEKRR
jgi:hypothetical protein